MVAALCCYGVGTHFFHITGTASAFVIIATGNAIGFSVLLIVKGKIPLSPLGILTHWKDGVNFILQKLNIKKI
jgi:hypothetical protein